MCKYHKEYTASDLWERCIELELVDIDAFDKWKKELREKIISLYKSKEKKNMTCSICGKKRDIEIFEGIGNESTGRGKYGYYHHKYIAICDSCATARKI